jgi:transcriptional regulator with XRE-family HTH domain
VRRVEFGRHLRAWRRAASITPSEIAEKLGIQRSSYLLIEAGQLSLSATGEEVFIGATGVDRKLFKETKDDCLER